MCSIWQLKLGMQLRGGMRITSDKWLTYFGQPFREGIEVTDICES